MSGSSIPTPCAAEDGGALVEKPCFASRSDLPDLRYQRQHLAGVFPGLSAGRDRAAERGALLSPRQRAGPGPDARGGGPTEIISNFEHPPTAPGLTKSWRDRSLPTTDRRGENPSLSTLQRLSDLPLVQRQQVAFPGRHLRHQGQHVGAHELPDCGGQLTLVAQQVESDTFQRIFKGSPGWVRSSA